MDMLLFCILVGVIAFKTHTKQEPVSEIKPIESIVDNSKRVAKINDTLYRDENAFSELINALGFPKE